MEDQGVQPCANQVQEAATRAATHFEAVSRDYNMIDTNFRCQVQVDTRENVSC